MHKKQKQESPKIVELPPEEDQEAEIVAPISAQPAGKILRQKYADIRRKKELKLLKLRGNEEFLNDDNEIKQNAFRKSARIAAKKISDKYKKIRNKKTVNLIDEV